MQVFLGAWALFREGFLASLVIGVCLPLVGTVMFLRRSIFLGVAVPQFSAAGLALGLLLLPWFPSMMAYYLEHGHPPTPYMFLFTVLSATAALWIFASLETRSRRGSPEARLAAGFVLASALSIAFLAASPAGTNLLEAILRGGQILLLDRHGLEITVAVFALVAIGLALLRRPIVLIAFDPDAAVAFGLPVKRFERWQMLLIGLAVAGGVMTAGPLLVFGLLFLPPLAARQFATTMGSFLRHAVLVGLLSVLGAWPLSLYLDQPYGPGVVILAGALTVLYWILARLRPPRSASLP